jgi:uncharacterized protein
MKNDTQHIILHLSGLADGDYTFQYELPEGALDLPDSFREKYDVRVELNKLRSQYVVKCTAETTSVHPCDRCLEPVHLQHKRTFTIIFTYGAGGGDAQFEKDEVRTLDPSDPKIDLTDEVREALLLGIPMRITCSDEPGKPECVNPYLQDYQQGSESVDPRWEVLKSKILATE